MNLWAISDLHLGIDANRRAVERVAARPEDWLILAGDIGDSEADLALAFEILAPRFARLIWVPGNHELWTEPRTPGAPRGVERYAALVELARRHGVITPEDPYLVWPGHGPKTMIAPLLLLCGQPLLLALRALPAERRGGAARALGRLRRPAQPLACLAIFSAAVLFTHLPFFYEATLRHPTLHDAEHALYLLAGSLLWWPVLDVDPAPSHRLGGLGRLAYVLAAMLPMALIGAYLNRHATLVYPAYGPPGHALGISAASDQQHAGALMWVAGNTIMAVVGLWAALAALIAEERRQQSREAREARSASATDGAAARGGAG